MASSREGARTPSRLSRGAGAIVVLFGPPSAEREQAVEDLRSRGHEVMVVELAEDAISAATNRQPDIIILVTPASTDVAKLCNELRTRYKNPVLIVHTGDAPDALIAALDAGADDVMVAPVSSAEFLVRVDVALRYRLALTALVSLEVLEVGSLRIDFARHAAVINGEPVEFSPHELQLLSLLARNVGHTVPTDAISEEIWPGEPPSPNRLRVCITRLRKLLAAHAGTPVVVAERGVGYRMMLGPPDP
jgi:two-component system OmpR family response regulator